MLPTEMWKNKGKVCTARKERRGGEGVKKEEVEGRRGGKEGGTISCKIIKTI